MRTSPSRTDWNISDKLKVFGRYSQFRTTLDQGNYTPNNSRAMPNDNGGIMNSRNIAGDVVYTMSPTTVLNFRGSYSMLEDDYSAPDYAVGEKRSGGVLAEQSVVYALHQGHAADLLPEHHHQRPDARRATERAATGIQHPHHYAFSGKMSQARGSHYLKFGAEYRYHVGIGIFPNLMNFNFYPDSTANTYLSPNTALSGDAHASFLLGVLDRRALRTARGYPFQTMRVPFIGTFIHDDWKISRRMTLNLGLRHEWESAPYDDNDIFSRYLDLNAPNAAMQKNPPVIPADLLALSTPKFNGAWVFTDSKQPQAVRHARKASSCRASAWRSASTTRRRSTSASRVTSVPVVTGRGTTSANTLAACQWCPGFNQTSTPLPFVEGRPQAYLSNPFPADSNPLQLPIGKSLGAYTNVGNACQLGRLRIISAQINDRMNFTIMREIPGQFKVDATWFMNIGRYVPHDLQVNMADPNLSYTYKAQLSQNIPNPFYNYLTPDVFPGDLRNQATVTRGSLLRPYPQYGGD